MRHQVGKFVWVAAAVFGFAQAADAASVTYYLNNSNTSLAPDGTVDFAKVFINEEIDGRIKFVVTALAPSGVYTPDTKFGIAEFGFNTSRSLVAAEIEDESPYSIDTNDGMDGFGKYEWTLKYTSDPDQPLVFFINDNTSGDVIGDYFALGAGGGEGTFAFAAHIKTAVLPDGSTKTFYVGGSSTDESSTPVVPLPAAAWLLLSGLGGLGVLGRRRKAA